MTPTTRRHPRANDQDFSGSKGLPDVEATP